MNKELKKSKKVQGCFRLVAPPQKQRHVRLRLSFHNRALHTFSLCVEGGFSVLLFPGDTHEIVLLMLSL